MRLARLTCLLFAVGSPYWQTAFGVACTIWSTERACKMQVRTCHCPTGKPQHCGNRGDGAVIHKWILMRRATTLVCFTCTMPSKQENADVTRQSPRLIQHGLFRELSPGPLATGARIISLIQAALGYALEYIYTHAKRIACTVTCIQGMLELCRRNESMLLLSL